MADLKTFGSAVTPASTEAKTAPAAEAEKKTAAPAEKKVAPAAEKKAAPAKKTAAKKTTTAKKTTAKKTTTTAKKTTTRKTAAKRGPAKKPDTTVYIQFNDMSIASEELTDRVKQIWKEKKNKVSDLKDIKVYVNIAESKAYYVVNGDQLGSFDI